MDEIRDGPDPGGLTEKRRRAGGARWPVFRNRSRGGEIGGVPLRIHRGKGQATMGEGPVGLVGGNGVLGIGSRGGGPDLGPARTEEGQGSPSSPLVCLGYAGQRTAGWLLVGWPV